MIACKDIVARVEALPPLPDTVLKLTTVIGNPRSSIDDMVEAIRYDQAVTSELLRLCNSAYFGLSRRITSLSEAIVCLGSMKVMQLVMSVHTNTLLKGEQRGYGLAAGELWRHSVAVALAASAAAKMTKLTNAGLAFTAGLLHDIGKVILDQYVAESFAEILRRVNEEEQSFLEAEQEVLGFSHQDIGAQVAEKWQLPDVMVRCIRHHHDPTSLDPPDPVVDMVYLADSITILLGIGVGADGLAYRADPAVLERRGFTELDLERLGAQTMVELKEVESLFGDSTRGRKNRVLAD